MNYIRGAISTISAPYQYYKEINPSTLTGAIDVIVVQRPAPNGETELVCSPFHVRFGKWQVLRPGEKKVNVSVNGHPIPFNMKIGEAGEAFFVFEADDDIPDDLITSPLLEPIHEDGLPDAEAQGVADADTKAAEEAQQEPDFLDLDAAPTPTKDAQSESAQPQSLDTPIKEPSHSLPSPPPSPTPGVTPSSLLASVGTKVDAVHHLADELMQPAPVHAPEVAYKHDVALDVEGYHIDGPVRDTPEDNTDTQKDEHPIASIHHSPSPSRTPQASTTPTKSNHPSQSRPNHSPSQPSPHLLRPPPSPLALRATSEPPPDTSPSHAHAHRLPHQYEQTRGAEEALSIGIPPPVQAPVQEYSWEWGAFPQPSPMQSGFPARFDKKRVKGRMGKAKAMETLDDDELELELDARERERGKGSGGEGEERDGEDEEGPQRSKSVPPELEASPTLSRRELPAESHHLPQGNVVEAEPSSPSLSPTGFGAGGRLTASRRDPARFGVYIEGKTVAFGLSIVPEDADMLSVFDGRDELEAAEVFERGKVLYGKFMEEEGVARDVRLVIKWAGGQYITRNDASPLMDALVLWRTATLQSPTPSRFPSPSASPKLAPQPEEEPLSSSDEHERQHGGVKRSDSEPLEMGKPTSSGWSRWWSRSKTSREAEGGRPGMRGNTSDAGQPQIPFPTGAPAAGQEHSETGHGRGKKFAKTLRLTSDQLKALNLKAGANTITFSLSTSGVIACTARIFVWDSTDMVLISDIDGTITKSDGLGHVFAMIGRDWTHIGVAKLYTDITRNGYKIMYLTSRAIGQADATRDYLKGIKQNDYQLPEGPVIMSPDRLMASLHREVIMRKPEVFKMACLRDIQRLFGEASRNPFYAGFGNRITDALSYRSVNVPSARIFTIDSAGEVKMELLELAGYKSSYIHMTDLVDQMFPPIHRKWAPEFTDFNYWKNPVQEFALPDLSPPSPALSARSDTSNRSTLARLRNFSLVGSRTSTAIKRQTLPASVLGHTEGGGHRSTHLRQMSSLERLGSTIAALTQSSSSSVEIPNSRRSVSPASRSSMSLTYADSGSEDEYGGADGFEKEKNGRRRARAKSVTSMPGSLDDMHFGQDDDGEIEGEEHIDNADGEDGYGYEGESEEGPENEEEAAEDAFDEDFFATGEMKNVPFL